MRVNGRCRWRGWTVASGLAREMRGGGSLSPAPGGRRHEPSCESRITRRTRPLQALCRGCPETALAACMCGGHAPTQDGSWTVPSPALRPARVRRAAIRSMPVPGSRGHRRPPSARHRGHTSAELPSRRATIEAPISPSSGTKADTVAISDGGEERRRDRRGRSSHRRRNRTEALNISGARELARVVRELQRSGNHTSPLGVDVPWLRRRAMSPLSMLSLP